MFNDKNCHACKYVVAVLRLNLGTRKVDYRCKDGGNNNPKQLEPIEERDTGQEWVVTVVERWPEYEKGDEE